MSVAPYPEYKDSGVEWIGEIPAHWKTKRFRYVFQECNDKIDGEIFGEMLSVSGYRGIEIKNYDDDNRRRIEDELQGYRIVRKGQLVINTMWMNYAGLGVSEFDGHVSPAYRAFKIMSYINKRYAHHLLRSERYVKGYTSYLTGIRPNSLQMSREDLMNLPVLLPSPEEQSAIAAFLDQETGKIDALVAEQERLIALLKEKRQAVISQAVTKGLNPNAPMKDSGIEWLGQVPAHWTICQLKRLFRSVDYGISDALSLEGSIIVLRMNNIQNGAVSLEDLKYTENVDQNLILEPGDLLYNRTNSLDLIGKVGVYEGKSENPVSFASYLVRFRLREGLPKYFSFLLNTSELLGVVRSSAYVAIGQCNLNPTKYGEIVVAVPPPEEQAYINNFLKAQVTAIDTLITEATQAITLLRERRAALISAAVTGKIDVRSLAPTEQEAA
jgi:type I restriction enzyme, S subunit